MHQKTNIVLAFVFFALSACSKSADSLKEDKLDIIRKDKNFQVYLNKKAELIKRLKEESITLGDNQKLADDFKAAQKNGKTNEFIRSYRKDHSESLKSLYKEISTNYFVVYYKYVVNDKIVTKEELRKLDLELTSNKKKLMRDIKM